MKKFYISALCFICSFLVSAQIPKVGTDQTFNLLTWNIEWFGDASNGPSNETLQFTNVKNAILGMQPDIMTVAEIADVSVFAQLVAQLPNYDYVLSSYSLTQKTGVIYRTDKFQVRNSYAILGNQNYDFASRPPLLIQFDNLNFQSEFSQFYVISIHLKAFADESSYNRRKNASAHLRTYINQNLSSSYVIIAGDWNDDLNYSIYNQWETPFKNFLDDSLNFKFVTQPLTQKGERSTVYYSTMIDHILVSNEWFPFFTTQSSQVIRLNNWITSYGSTTSDHYPVAGLFQWKKSSTTVSEEKPFQADLKIFPNPANPGTTISWNATSTTYQLEIVNILGQMVWKNSGHSEQGKTMSIRWDGQSAQSNFLSSGWYGIRLTTGNQTQMKSFFLIQ